MDKEIKNLIEKIDNHRRVYEYCSIDVPPYRILQEEIIILKNYLLNMFCPISYSSPKEDTFMGVTLEIVKKGDF